MDILLKDIRYSLRGLWQRPGFAAIAIATFALGIGINAALFSVVNSVVVNPLPFPDSDQLVTFDQSKPNFDNGAVTYPNFLDLRKENRTFSAMTLARSTAFSLIGADGGERVNGRFVSADFCTVFGVKPVMGRSFTTGEDEFGAPATVMITYELWQRKFAGSPMVISQTLTLDDKVYAIVGVLPADFQPFSNSDVFVPIGQWNTPALKNRGAGLGLHGIGRLKPGVTIGEARADLNRVMQNLAVTYPDTNRNNGAAVGPLKERIVGTIRGTLWMLLGAVTFVLLIACVNVGNLMLARSAGRRREFAIRAALGAGRWRLLRQSLTESLVLALIGGAAGVLLANWGVYLALKLLPTTLPRASEVRLDTRALIFAFLISLLSGMLAGLGPGLRNARARLAGALKEGARGASMRGRAHGVLVAIEVALAVVLLIGGGLMIRSLRALWSVDPGFRPDNVLTFNLSLPPSALSAQPQSIRASVRQLSDLLNTTPGIRAASFSAGGSPLQGEDDLFFWLDGQPRPASQSEMNMALVYRVEPAYLTALGIPLQQGRFFNDHDDERSQPVVVIDEVFARKFFGAANPIGKRICQTNQEPQTIVGVVGHVKQWGLDSDDRQSLRAQLYEPFRQVADAAMSGIAGGVGLVVRGDGVVPIEFDNIRRVVQTQNSQNVVFAPQTMNEAISESLAQRRFAMILLDGFALLALLLATLGIYGVISYLVGLRTHELGIRIALGAQRSRVLGLVLTDGIRLAAVGVAIGLLASVMLMRLLRGMLYGVSSTDPITFAVTAGVLMLTAGLACYLPARRATKVDPLVALRYE